MPNPSFVQPMLATRVAKLPTGPAWQYEVKWDGYRILAVKIGPAVQLFSRRSSSYTDKFKPITNAVAGIHAHTAILDGEVVAADSSGQPSFQVLQSRGKLPPGYHLVYYVFDLLFLNGKHLQQHPLAQRRANLPEILANTPVHFSAPIDGSLSSILKVVRRHNLEGVIAKRRDSVYEPGRRTLTWQKLPLKPKKSFVIAGYRPAGSLLELILVGYYDGKKLLFAGKVRAGLNPASRRKLLTLLKPLSTPKCPFSNLPTSRTGHWGEGVTAEEMKDYTWTRPEMVADIKFTEWTTGYILRHPEFVGLRDDKPPREITRGS